MCLDLNKYTVLFFVAASTEPENSCETNPSEYVYNSVHKSKRVTWKREKKKKKNVIHVLNSPMSVLGSNQCNAFHFYQYNRS